MRHALDLEKTLAEVKKHDPTTRPRALNVAKMVLKINISNIEGYSSFEKDGMYAIVGLMEKPRSKTTAQKEQGEVDEAAQIKDDVEIDLKSEAFVPDYTMEDSLEFTFWRVYEDSSDHQDLGCAYLNPAQLKTGFDGKVNIQRTHHHDTNQASHHMRPKEAKAQTASFWAKIEVMDEVKYKIATGLEVGPDSPPESPNGPITPTGRIDAGPTREQEHEAWAAEARNIISELDTPRPSDPALGSEGTGALVAAEGASTTEARISASPRTSHADFVAAADDVIGGLDAMEALQRGRGAAAVAPGSAAGDDAVSVDPDNLEAALRVPAPAPKKKVAAPAQPKTRTWMPKLFS